MRPSQTILVLEDLCNCYTGPLFRKGERLNSYDRSTVIKVYQQWLLLMCDLGYLHHVTLKRDGQRIFADMVKSDVLDLNNAFAELLHLVRVQSIKGFKAPCKRISTHLSNIVKDDFVSMHHGDVFAAKRLVQLFSYTSRLSLAYVDLTQQCLDDYMDIEGSMPKWYPASIVSGLNTIVKRWLTSFDPTRLKFNHGPGAVAGHGSNATLEIKYKDLSHDRYLLDTFGQDWYPSESPFRSSLDRISQTIFVPKSYKTFRTISMESSTLQYYQQGVWKEIKRVVESSPYLSARMSFKKAGRNFTLAQEASMNRNYATLDLSAASDSVSYSLVKQVFKGTKLLKYLGATRSRRTLLPDGRLITLKKFAPMGSALCFPVETIIFAAICQYVTREHGVTSDYSVYGDDLIVPSQCAEDVISVLGSLGFKTNLEKSFYDKNCWFRESCGGEFCDGYDVTPLRISRKYRDPRQEVPASGLRDLANRAYKKGFRNLRAFFLREMSRSHFIPRFGPTATYGDNYTNYHTRRRWNSNLQRIDVWATSLSISPLEEVNESIRYRHWLESTADREFLGDGFSSYTGRVSVKTRNRWMAKPYEESDQPFIDFFVQMPKTKMRS